MHVLQEFGREGLKIFLTFNIHKLLPCRRLDIAELLLT